MIYTFRNRRHRTSEPVVHVGTSFGREDPAWLNAAGQIRLHSVCLSQNARVRLLKSPEHTSEESSVAVGGLASSHLTPLVRGRDARRSLAVNAISRKRRWIVMIVVRLVLLRHLAFQWVPVLGRW